MVLSFLTNHSGGRQSPFHAWGEGENNQARSTRGQGEAGRVRGRSGVGRTLEPSRSAHMLGRRPASIRRMPRL